MVSTASSDSSLPVLLTESRSHNTEVRLVLSKVQDKLDIMSQKVLRYFLAQRISGCNITQAQR